MGKIIFSIVLGLFVLDYGLMSKNSAKDESHNLAVNSKNKTVTQDSLILWKKNSKLSWDNFQGKPDTITFRGFAAVSNIRIPFENFKVYDDSVVMDLPCYFVITKSWKLTATPVILNHEQGHFDIAEIIARKMRKELANYIDTDGEASTKFYQWVSDKYYDSENDALNKAYDKETDFSKNAEGQKRWNAKIAQMLKELEAYSSPHVVMKRVKR